MLKELLYLWLLTPLYAQDVLSLRDAVRMALDHNKSIQAAAAGSQAAGERVNQAKSGRLPRLNYSESLTRSDNPGFVFSSLLTQHQFTQNNFDLGALNEPNALNNFQSQLSLDQTIYDAGQLRRATRSAGLVENISGEERRRTEQDVIAGVVRAYYAVVLSGENLAAAKEAVRSGEADLKRAEAVRAAGMSTDVDVLSIRVHLAGVTEQQIRRAADVDVARAALDDVLGQPLEAVYQLTTALAPADLGDISLEQYEHKAVDERPEGREAKLAMSLAETEAKAARSNLLPQVGLHAAIEEDRQQFAGRAGGNWLASVSLRWNVFNGFGDKARIEETRHLLRRSQAEKERAGSAIRLEVRRAWADLRAATQRIEVAQAAVQEAQESLRITQNRYGAGLNNVTDLLRNETAVLEAKTRYLAAINDQRVARAMLEKAAGTLLPDSEVLN
ncbi:MAG TPA: TolC family protein [Bryobacteraceae bacterium]|nr:TolC family protein [Bryobacteraceae bacterium]